MFSIDQNCHSLWDVLPKLHALASAGQPATHYIEDVDVAFTAVAADRETPLHMARERFFRGGAADWGAALFYMPFLSRLAVDVQHWQSPAGMKIGAMAKKLGLSVDDLYDNYSPGDNLQLIGPSFVGDRHDGMHRVIGDLTTAETTGFLRELLTEARADMLRSFPSHTCRARTNEWMDHETNAVERIVADHADERLIDVYHDWMAMHLAGASPLNNTSALLACGEDLVGRDVLEVFVGNYDHAAGLYNQAIDESRTSLRHLDRGAGELPMFAAITRDGHRVRTGAHLIDGQIVVGDAEFAVDRGHLPLEAMAAGGIDALAGKAAVLVCQVRSRQRGASIAVPEHGSLYMPAVHLLERKLADAGLLPEPLHPLVRVRLGFLDRLSELDVPIALPEHLAAAFGREEVSTRHFAENWRSVAVAASRRLAQMEDPATRSRWPREHCPDLAEKSANIDTRRRELAKSNAPPEGIRPLWDDMKAVQKQILQRMLTQIATDWQLRDLAYWDSRGAILPWAVALGGQDFYNSILRNAEIYQETPESA